MKLKNGAKVGVLGGGPGGAFFAIHLLRNVRKVHVDISVTIIDKKVVLGQDGSVWDFKGCNFCAGVLSPRFIPPVTRRALVFELKPGRAYLKKYMDREIYLIISGAIFFRF